MNKDEIEKLLIELYNYKDNELLNKYDRSLSFEDCLFDRWERAKRLGFESGSSIYNSALIYGDVKVGKETWIGPQVILDGSGGGIKIGSTCSISAGVHIYTHDTVRWALSGGLAIKNIGQVRIGDCSYIGPQSIITAGVTIGNQCVIGANSFVNKDILDKSFVGGTPAKLLGYIDGEGKNVKIRLIDN